MPFRPAPKVSVAASYWNALGNMLQDLGTQGTDAWSAGFHVMAVYIPNSPNNFVTQEQANQIAFMYIRNNIYLEILMRHDMLEQTWLYSGMGGPSGMDNRIDTIDGLICFVE